MFLFTKIGKVSSSVYTGRLFHWSMWNGSICHFRGVGGIFCGFYSILLASNVDPDKTPNHAASDLGLHCLPVKLLRVPR